DVLANDTDVDGGPQSIASVTQPGNGSVVFTGGGTGLTYQPDPNFFGIDTFTYSLTPGGSTATVTVTVTAVNDAPEVSVTQVVAALAEDTDTTSRIKIADIVVSDDELGSETLALSGGDAGLFEIDGTELYLRAGTGLDFETQTLFDVSVTVDDTTVGSTPDDSAAVSLSVTDVNEAPSGRIAILGSLSEFATLVADLSGLSDPEGIQAASATFQWFRDGAEISGAVGATYTTITGDVGTTLSVRVAYLDGTGNSETSTSVEAGPVLPTDQNLVGGSGENHLTGGAGDDTVTGQDQDDILSGGAGNDSILGGGGNDRLRGEDGNDTLDGGDGADTVSGGAGDDLLSGEDGDDLIVGGDGADTVFGGNGDDTVFGMGGDDVIVGGEGNDVLAGQDGNDVLTGGAGTDLLFGGAGDDFLNGGTDNDLLHGGSGADRFFHFGHPSHGTDWIADFSSEESDVLLFWNSDGSGVEDFTVVTGQGVSPGGELAGDDAVDELFVIHQPTGMTVWALVDGADLSELNLRLALTGATIDLLA
ncbi:Ig-like domain-containing protein, partial [Ruegeria sp. WL0004]